MVWICTLLIVFIVGKTQELIVPETVMVVLRPTIFSLVIGIVGQVLFRKPMPSAHRLDRPTTRYWGLFILGMMATVPTSIHTYHSLVEFLILKYLPVGLVCFLLVRNLRSVSDVNLTTIAMVGAVAAINVAMIVAPRVFKQDDGPDRMNVTLTYDPNDIGLVVAMTLPLLYYWFVIGSPAVKLVIVPIAAMTFITIYRTGSRGALVTAGIVILYLGMAAKESGALARILLFALLLAGAAFMTQTETFRALISGVSGNDYNAKDESGRLAIWQRGLGYVATNPILGVGVDNFVDADFRLSGREHLMGKIPARTAHNSYIQIAAENGVITFGIWIALIVSVFLETGRCLRQLSGLVEDSETIRYRLLIRMFRCSIIAFLVGGFFLSVGYFAVLYVVFAWVLALANIGDQWRADLGLEPLGYGAGSRRIGGEIEADNPYAYESR